MFSVLALAGIERLCNAVLTEQVVRTPAFIRLIGKSLQVNIGTPPVSLVVVFAEDHVRFDPVVATIFEPQGGITPDTPDCVLSVKDLKQLYALLQNPSLANTAFNISGDKGVWQDIEGLLYGVQPAIMQYELLITDSLTSLWQKLPLNKSANNSPLNNLNEQLEQAISDKLDLLADLDRQILAKQQQLSSQHDPILP